MAYDQITGTKATELTAFIGSIPDAQLVIVPDPVTGELFRTTFGQIKSDIIAAFGGISYLDPIVEVDTVADLPSPGAIKTLYVITTGADINTQWRWAGSMYIEFPHGGDGDVAGEAVIRGNADAALQANINAEAAARAAADTGLQNNINTEATARSNADTTLTNSINSEANTRSNSDASLLGLINGEGVIRANADTALQANIDGKVDKITGMGLSSNDFTTDEKTKLAGLESSRFKGTFVNKAALDAANLGGEGNYADVDAGVGADVARYIWDNDDDKWVLQQGATTAETAASIKAKYESNPDTNAYTDAEKAKLGGISAGAQVNDANTTLQGNTFNGNAQLVKTDAGGKLPGIDGSQLTNLPGGAVKATAAELNTGIDDAKFATAFGLESSKYLNQSGSKVSATASGTDTYAAAISPAIAAYSATQRFFIKFTNANTGAATLNLNSLGAIAIKKNVTTALSAGDITAGQILCVAFDGTNFQIVGNSSAGAGGGAGSPVGIASGTNTYVVACTPTVTSLTTNLCVRIKFTNANTGACTINVDSLGAIAINKGPSTALTAGIITAGQIFELYYDGTVWQLGNTQAIPSTPNKVITTDGSGVLQGVNDIIDINSTTTEATLIAATWTVGVATATGTPGTWVLGTTSNYLYICTGTNTWIRIPAYLDYLDIYLGAVSDSGGKKTSTQMATLYPSAVRGQYAVGTAGMYMYMGMVGWYYFANTI